MKSWRDALTDGALTGTVAGVATALTAVACGQAESHQPIAPLNAVSHIVWGDEAATVDEATARHTAVGFALNHGACLFWATLFEKLFGTQAERGDAGAALLGGAAVSGIAYVTDYYLVPKRLTPGFEKRLSGRSLGAIYGVLALSLGATALLRSRG